MQLDYTYVAFGVRADPEAIVEGMRTLGIRGLAVTMPYKETVLPHLDRLDPIANDIGAVNTIVNDDGVLTGHNVDWIGVTGALEHHGIQISRRRAVVVGAGGAARAAVFGLLRRGASRIVVFNRTDARGRALADDLGVEFGGDPEALTPDYDLLVHATSAGHLSQPNLRVIPDRVLAPGKTVFDVVPEPVETPLILAARSAGCSVIAGYHMRLHQAAAQIELYTGKRPPIEFMESVLLNAMGHRKAETKAETS